MILSISELWRKGEELLRLRIVICPHAFRVIHSGDFTSYDHLTPPFRIAGTFLAIFSDGVPAIDGGGNDC